MPATLLDHVTPAMRIYHEETFGPVKAIVRVRNTEEAIACANDNEYGLSAAVFGKRHRTRLQRGARIDSGICHVNGTDCARRGADALRRRQGLGHGPLRRQGRHCRIYRAALDHGADDAAALSVLGHRLSCRA
jgi:acyl-CoA reductase-like NAD-dependent aldehyde dehydrogenase